MVASPDAVALAPIHVVNAGRSTRSPAFNDREMHVAKSPSGDQGGALADDSAHEVALERSETLGASR